MFSVVYQGPTTFYQKIPSIKNHEAIFSTWEDEPHQNIKYLEKIGFKVILNKKPVYSGFHNINLQTVSSLSGINNSLGEYILKIRSDMIVDKMDFFLDILSKEKMSFLCYHNYNGGYLCDYLNFGHRDDMIFWWDYIQKDTVNKPPEIQLLENFLSKKYLENNRTFDYISDKFNFFIKDLIKYNINITWLKRDLNLKDYINDNLFLY